METGAFLVTGALLLLLNLVITSSAEPEVSSTDVAIPKNGGSVPAINVVTEEPEFTETIENITVPAGRNVKLACSVKNLGSYKVAWMHFEQSAILTVHNHVITRNPRISVTHDKHDKYRTWFLHINDVKEEDKGRYMCQINTVTAKTQFGYLHVVVPPNIDDSLSSSDIIVREGANITLKCKATGSPTPTVKWKRDDNSKIAINKSLNVLEWDGEVLEISRISRLDMGSYLCIASNGVRPTVSKRIKVSVDFPPMMMIPHQLIGVTPHTNVTLECLTEAHPTSLNYWTKEDGNMIHDSKKFKSESIVGHPTYKTTMRLTISNIEAADESSYKCVAKNPRGESEGTIRLYISPPLVPVGVTSTTTEVVSVTPEGNGVNWDNEVYVRFNKTLYKQSSDDNRSDKFHNTHRKVDRYEHQNSIGQGKGFNKYPLENFNVNSGPSVRRQKDAILVQLSSLLLVVIAVISSTSQISHNYFYY